LLLAFGATACGPGNGERRMTVFENAITTLLSAPQPSRDRERIAGQNHQSDERKPAQEQIAGMTRGARRL
jgi:alpha-ketoglutarate-dependent taurine dioxygenase